MIRGKQKILRERYVVALKGSATCAAITKVDEAHNEPEEASSDIDRGMPAKELELVLLMRQEKWSVSAPS